MKLERLNNSIALNAEEAPSIYAAICMIESLFRDIKEESGLPIQSNPMGDETLPTKLVWLSRMVLEIYNTNKDQFSRSNKQLEEKIHALQAASTDLDQIAALSQQLSEQNKQLEDAEARKTALDTQLKMLQAQAAQVQAEIQSLQGNQTDLQAQLEQGEGQKQQLAAEKDTLAGKYADLQVQLKNLQAANDSYETTYLRPLQTKLAEQETQAATKEQSRRDLKAQLDALTQSFTQLGVSVAQIEQDIEETQKKLSEREAAKKKKEQIIADLREKQSRQDDELKELSASLSGLQEQTAAMEQDTLPQLKALRDLQQDRLNQLSAEQEQLQLDQQELEQKEHSLEAELDTKRTVYTALTSRYDTNNSELQELQRRINELKGKTDEEQHEEYKHQLEESIEKLTRLDEACRELEQQITEKNQQIETADSEYNRLKTVKENYEKALADLKALLSELAPIATPEYTQKAAVIQKKLDMVSQSRKELAEVLDLICGEIGQSEQTETAKRSLSDVAGLLEKLETQVNQLCNKLTAVAGRIKLEEQ